ncbi:MAG TPA: hypothetical protein DCM40_00900 [Maribacter sp.]|uniref:hypothetical protein n=1 Tax=Maribacter sp. UBA4516 TaxID=1946804 RepID=UPI000EBE2E9B|nr:hypothetical protein [Maribacter sp. UBA4516]HAI36785.1 hypothetical protein [Maribacter sp.]|tara:strand:+ start:450 stop:1016 length:567 start_codon:yes stop_codon:yes gene_type:complete
MSESILFEILKKSKENKEIIGIWKYNDDDGFWAGYVKDYNEELVTIQHFTKYGKSDGIIVERIENIKSVDFDDDYAKAMQCLIDYSSELDKDNPFEIELNDNEEWQIGILKQLEGTDRIARLEINGSDYFSGFIKRLSESDLIIHCVGKMGEDEGTVFYRIEDVTAVRVNDIENRKRVMLFNWRKASL